MATRSLSRWQKASALVPMGLLVTAWGVAVSTTGLANASGGSSDDVVPDVPQSAISAPASVAATPSGIDPRGGSSAAVSTLSPNGIPSAALYAYRRAETLLAKADETCNLPWNLLAAIGRVESNHGRVNANTLSSEGVAKPGIYGIALDGKNNTARITDTDGGKLDKDTVYDRAVGPMQFIPGTWNSVGIDADADGEKNPQDIDDAATAAGVYLCAGPGDLSDSADAATAVRRYNNSSSYVDLVLDIAGKYGEGEFTETSNSVTTSPMLTNRSADQTFTQAQRDQSAAAEKKANKPKKKPKKDNPGSSSGGNGGTSTGGSGSSGGGGSSSGGGGSSSGGGSGSGGGGGNGGGSGGGGSTIGGGVQDATDGLGLGGATKPVTDLLSRTEANLRCTLSTALLPSSTYNARFASCMKTFGY